MSALAPGLLLTGTINWDLIPVLLTVLALLAWARRRPWLAGIMIGLAVAAKLFPLLLLVPLFLLCIGPAGPWTSCYPARHGGGLVRGQPSADDSRPGRLAELLCLEPYPRS